MKVQSFMHTVLKARIKIEEKDGDDVVGDDDADERVGKTLHKWQMENSSWARRFIAKSIKSSESEDEVYNEGGDDVAVEDGDDDVAGEKRKRVAEAYLEKMREMARREMMTWRVMGMWRRELGRCCISSRWRIA
nr:hypothetical protein [Tanacetum cinerariifolium]